jgi:molecular chaperone GrpE
VTQDPQAAEELNAQENVAETPETAAEANGAAPGAAISQEELEKVQQQAQQYLDGWQRERAEFANYKRRMEREMKEAHQNISAEVIKDLLPILDDFERAFDSMTDTIANDAWTDGLRGIQRKFNKVLEEYGVTPIDPTGEMFDPNCHEAVGTDESSEAASGTITATMQKGYLVGERVLRPALVRVAK